MVFSFLFLYVIVIDNMNKQADALNKILQERYPVIYNLLSEKGRNIFFPKEGIVAQAAEARGKKINATLGSAVEDDGSPMRLESLAKNISIDPKDTFSYAPTSGKIELRKIWKDLMYKKNPSLRGDTSLPIATIALTHGLSVIGYLFVNPLDEIILTDKFWGNYRLIFENAYGGALKAFTMFKGNSFDIDDFQRVLFEKSAKKIILLNFPNNPTGYAPTIQEAKKIIRCIFDCAEAGNEILVICDDAYFGLVYENGIYQESLFSELSHIHKNVLAVKIDGATKEEYAWGLRVGFITFGAQGITEEACNALEAKTAGVIRGSVSNAPNISQGLIYQSLISPEHEREKNEKYQILKSRYEKVKKVLSGYKYEKYFSPLPFNSGYFMCIQLKGGLNGEAVRQELLKNYDTGVISIGNILRIAFSGVKESDIEVLFENIYKACERIAKLR